MPASAFDIAVRFVLEHEGGLHHDVAGGLTKFGISAKAFPDLDIAGLTERDAWDIYRARYWQAAGLDGSAIPGEVGIAVMDAAVNLGVVQAVRLLQGACNLLGCDLKRDGDLGPKTRATVRALVMMDFERATMLALLVTARRTRFYYLLAQRNKDKYERYLGGWLRRCEDLVLMLIKRQMSAK